MSPLAREELGHPAMPWERIVEGLMVVAAGVALFAATLFLQV